MHTPSLKSQWFCPKPNRQPNFVHLTSSATKSVCGLSDGRNMLLAKSFCLLMIELTFDDTVVPSASAADSLQARTDSVILGLQRVHGIVVDRLG